MKLPETLMFEPQTPLHQIAVLIVDYFVAMGVLKDAETLRCEGERRERARQKKKALSNLRKKKAPPKIVKKKSKAKAKKKK